MFSNTVVLAASSQPERVLDREADILEEANQRAGRDLRHPRHQGATIISSSTCTRLSPWEMR